MLPLRRLTLKLSLLADSVLKLRMGGEGLAALRPIHVHALPETLAAAGYATAFVGRNMHQSADSGDLDQDHDCTTCHANALTGVPSWPHWPSLPEGTAIIADASPFHLSPPPPARRSRAASTPSCGFVPATRW